MEFMVMMDIRFPANMTLEARRELLSREAAAAAPYLDSGEFARVWRTWGSHEGDHGHLALWDAQSENVVRLAYASFPLVKLHYGTVRRIFALEVNPNDRTTPAVSPFPLTYDNLYPWLTDHGKWSDVQQEGLTAEVVKDQLWVHDHPHSGRPRELHVMCPGEGGWQKIAEIGPVTKGDGEDVAPGYIDLLAEWDGRPVDHDNWKNALLRDNGLLHGSHEAAKNAPRIRREI